ncbi:MAG: AAA family ATPase [Candidatus Dormibacteraeota bacterium]|nr:AAA family ATPase [Candidatus Dormibacteraeota bacterium]
MIPAVDPLDVFADPTPRAFTIADARLRLQESLEHLPVLGADGFVVKGWSHLLAGWWRLGKTELMAAIVLPWLRSGLRVLWLTEEPDSLWADRADMVDEIYAMVPWELLTLVDAMSAKPEDLLSFARSADADVIIVDTLREVCGVQSMKDDEAVRRAVSPWLRELRDGKRTLIFLAQHRKAEGSDGQRIEGTIALPSMMDVALELERVDGHDRRRRLTCRRRRGQPAALVYEMDADDRLVVIPDARSRSRVETEAAVLFAINASSEPLTTMSVRQELSPKPSRDTVARALMGLAERGLIVRDPPITEVGERRKVTWACAPGNTPGLPQNSLPPTWEFGAAESVAADSCQSDALNGRLSGRVGLHPGSL